MHQWQKMHMGRFQKFLRAWLMVSVRAWAKPDSGKSASPNILCYYLCEQLSSSLLSFIYVHGITTNRRIFLTTPGWGLLFFKKSAAHGRIGKLYRKLYQIINPYQFLTLQMLRQNRGDMKITELHFLSLLYLIIIFLNFFLSLQQPKIKASDWLKVERICLYKPAKWQLWPIFLNKENTKITKAWIIAQNQCSLSPREADFFLLVTYLDSYIFLVYNAIIIWILTQYFRTTIMVLR